MLKDSHQKNRRPRTLQLYYRGATIGDRSKSQPLPFQAAQIVAQTASQGSEKGRKDGLQERESASQGIAQLAESECNKGATRATRATRAGDEATRVGDEANRVGDEATRVGDEATRAGDEATRAGDVQGAEKSVDPTVAALAFVLMGTAVSMLEKAEGALPCSRLALAATDFVDLQVQVGLWGRGYLVDRSYALKPVGLNIVGITQQYKCTQGILFWLNIG